MPLSRLDGSILQGSALFADLDRAALDGLARLARHKTLAPGQALFRQGDPCNGCYAILKGALKVSATSARDEELLLAVLSAGDVVGEMGLFGAAPRSATVTALKPCSLAFLASGDFRRFADDHPTVYHHTLEIVCARLRAANEAFAAYQALPLAGRLAQVLLRLADGFGQPLDDGRILIRQKFTQADLARMTGSARENVNRRLGDWRGRGIVSRIGGYYCIEQDRLRRQAAGP